MFSQVSVCPQGEGVSMLGARFLLGGGYAWSQVPSRRWVCPVDGYTRGLGVGIPESKYTRGQGWATTTRTVGKRTVRILLECGLVDFNFALSVQGPALFSQYFPFSYFILNF